jgi:HAD superfamily hydrolase (TIGR01549 family)
MSAVICDIDGTLVDTNYHHAIAWYRAFRQNDVIVPVWRIHRAIGMGGDQLVSALAGEDVEREKGDDIRAAEKPLYMAMIEEVEPLEGAHGLLEDLHDRELTTILASSAKADEAEHYLDLLDARDLVAGWTTSADVEQTKPDPDIVKAAMAKAGTDEAVMVGDSVWDVFAANQVKIPTVAVLTGGYSREELTEAGARQVFDSIPELRGYPEALEP